MCTISGMRDGGSMVFASLLACLIRLPSKKRTFFLNAPSFMRITDRPGRYFALFVFAPLLLLCGKRVHSAHPTISKILTSLGFLLFLYESFWVSRKGCEFTFL